MSAPSVSVRPLKQCDLSLPNRCIFRCRMCRIWQLNEPSEPPGTLTAKDYRKFLYEIKGITGDQFVVSIGGGEPLLSKMFFEIAGICKELGFKMYFPTNAFLIDEQMAEMICSAGISSLGISLDSLDAGTHDYLRGKPGAWDRAIRAVDILKKYSPGLSINILTVIMGPNAGGIIDLAKWVNANDNLHGIVFQAISRPANVSCGDNWQDSEEFRSLWPRDTALVNAVIEELITLRKNNQRGFKICNPVGQLETFKRYFNNPLELRMGRRCHLGRDTVRIDHCGNAMFCWEMYSLGNIKQTSLSSLLSSPAADELRNQIHNCGKNCYEFLNCFYDGEPE
jgi:MoaA/NifB/PqqE/SkfB family radical SAM enzyme